MTRHALVAILVSAFVVCGFSCRVHAQLRHDALVQAPELKRPARGTVGSALAGFELSASALARGSAALPSPFAVPTERGAPALTFLPSYLADHGISEWGVGWNAALSIRRFQPVGAIDYATDRFTSPWGALSRGADGAYYVDGLQPRMRLELANDAWTAVGPDGTHYLFHRQDALTTERGAYEWWISEATALTGERTSFEYTTGASGRRYLARVLYGGRAGIAQTEVTFDYTPLAQSFVDRRSGTAVALDRRVAAAAIAMWDPHSARYLERYRYALDFTFNPAGVAHYLTAVRRIFASGAAEPEAQYSYRFGEADALSATAHEAAELSRYLARFGPGSLAPSKATYVDIDRDGRTDIENAYDHELARHTDSGMTFEPLARDGSELALCRPGASVANAPRALLRWTPAHTALRVLRFVRQAADTSVYQCDRQGHQLATVSLPGDWRLGPNTRLADVDRDLRPDLVRLTRGRLEIKRNVSGAGLAFADAAFYTLTPAIAPSRSWIVDLNGDGVADLVAVGNSAFYVWAGLGTGGFERAATRLPLLTTSGSDIGSIEESEVAFVDANRDGYTDVLLSRGPALRLLTHRGTSLQQIDVPAFGGLTWDASYPITVDLEGVGEEQAVVSAGTVAYAISFTSPSAGLMVSAHDSKGGRLDLEYTRAPATAGLTTRPPLLSLLRVADAGLDTLEYRFDYDHPVFHSQGEYLLGYRTVRRTSPIAIEEATFSHDDHQTALPLRTTSVDTISPDLPAGLSLTVETRYESATYHGLAYQRAIETTAGLFDASGGAVRTSRTQTLVWSADGLCPLTTRVDNDRFQRTSVRTLASPSRLVGALHCLFATETDSASHAARPDLDFVYTAHVARTPIGQIEILELVSAATTVVAQVNRYDAQHRLAESGAPGRGVTRVSYEPTTGDVLSVTGPDGVVRTATARQARSSAITALAEDRGASVPYEHHFGYDDLERLTSRYDNVGAGSAALPDEVVTYAYAAAERPASIVARLLVDAASASYASASEWLSASGVSLAQGTRIPEGWAVSGVSVPTRSAARTDTYHRGPMAHSDGHAVVFAELFDPSHSTPLGRVLHSLFGHTPRVDRVLQASVSRTLTQRLTLDAGDLVRATYDNGALLSTERLDGDGRLVHTSDAAGHATTFSYDALGRLVDLVLPGGMRQSGRFDDLGRVRSITHAGIGHLEYAYDPVSGLLTEKREYDQHGALVRRTEQRHDAVGRETVRRHVRATDASEQVYAFFYDGHLPDGAPLAGQTGRVSAVHGPHYAKRTVYRADGLPAHSDLTIAGWRRIRETYDYFEDGTILTVRRDISDASGTLLHTLARTTERDSYGRARRLVLDDGTPRTLYEIAYDGEGRISHVVFVAEVDSAQSRVSPRYDPQTHQARGYGHVGPDWELQMDEELDTRMLIRAEHIQHRVRGQAPVAHDRWYTYDNRRFLTGMASPDGNAAYAYAASGLLERAEDAAGARLVVRTEGAITAGGTTYRFDAAGRLVERGELVLRYGANGQIETATRGAKTWSFVYDEADQRVLKLADGVPVAAYLGDSLLTAQGVIEPLRVAGRVVGVLDNGVFTPVPTDPRGSVVGDPDGTYRPLSPYGVRAMHPALAQALDYVGKGYDADLGLVRMGVRDYDPFLAQFTTPDELFREDINKCVESPLPCHLYAYAMGNPLSYIDPTGLDPKELKPDTPEHEVLYGAGMLFFGTDHALGEGMIYALGPLRSENVPTPVKVGYAIIAPVPMVVSGAAFAVKHVGESAYHVVKGSVRLVLEPIIDVLSSPSADPVPTIDIPSSSPYASKDTHRSRDYPTLPPNALKELLNHYTQALGHALGQTPDAPGTNRNPQKNVAPRPLNNSEVRGCQFGPDSPDPRGKAYPGVSPLR